MSFSNGEQMKRRALASADTLFPATPAVDPSLATSDVSAAPDAARQFLGAAQRVAEAEFQAERARSRLIAAETRQSEINARIADLDARKSAIIARRSGGECEPDDAARVALLDADLTGLHRLLHDQAAATALALSETNNADRAVVLARQHLALAEDQRAHITLSQHANALSKLLVQTMGRLSLIEERLDRSTKASWVPPRELSEELRRRALLAR